MFGALVMLVIITMLGRTMTLSQFGTYGLVVATANYLLVFHGSVQSSAVRAIALARNQYERDRIFSNAIVLHICAGLLAGSLVAGAGWFLIGVLGIPHTLQFDARVAALILGAVMLLGWPMKIFQDLLLGTQRFVDAAIAEIISLVIFGAGMSVLIVARMPLWLIMGMGGGLPVLTGLASAGVVQHRHEFARFRTGAVQLDTLRQLAHLSGNLLVGSTSSLVIYALDRGILTVFRGASAVGLYEGPVRIHNFVQTVQSTLGINVLPAAADYYAEHEEEKLRDLMLRGTRYVLAITLPLTITLMILAKPLLAFWLGKKFAVAGTAATILLGYWLISVNQAVPSQLLVASGHARWLAKYAWIVAVANLSMSILLTWRYGLIGVVLGTAIPFVLAFPAFLRKACSVLPFTPEGLLRIAWLPGYSTALIVGVALVVVRLAVPIDNAAELVSLTVGAPLAYWIIFYVLWTTPSERVLVRDLVRIALRNPFHSFQHSNRDPREHG